MSRQGKLAPGKTHVIFVTTEELKARLRELAEAEGRTLSNFLENSLRRLVARRDVQILDQRPEFCQIDRDLRDMLASPVLEMLAQVIDSPDMLAAISQVAQRDKLRNLALREARAEDSRKSKKPKSAPKKPAKK